MRPPAVGLTCTAAVLLPSVAMPIVQPIANDVVDGSVTAKYGAGLLRLDTTLPLSAAVAA